MITGIIKTTQEITTIIKGELVTTTIPCEPYYSMTIDGVEYTNYNTELYLGDDDE